MTERAPEREGVRTHLTLRDVRHLIAVEELDRVFDRDDVDPPMPIDVMNQGRETGRLARSGDPGNQHQAPRLQGDLLEHLGQEEFPERSDFVGDGPEREGERPPLLIDVGPEPPDPGNADREVRLFLFGELLDLARRHDLLGEVLEFFGTNRLHRQRLEIAVDPYRGRAPHLEQQVGGLPLHHLRDGLLEIEWRGTGDPFGAARLTHWDPPGKGLGRTRPAGNPRRTPRG